MSLFRELFANTLPARGPARYQAASPSPSPALGHTPPNLHLKKDSKPAESLTEARRRGTKAPAFIPYDVLYVGMGIAMINKHGTPHFSEVLAGQARDAKRDIVRTKPKCHGRRAKFKTEAEAVEFVESFRHAKWKMSPLYCEDCRLWHTGY